LFLEVYYFLFYFFFSSRRRHTRFKCDWSSDVCSSDLSFRLSARTPCASSQVSFIPRRDEDSLHARRQQARASVTFVNTFVYFVRSEERRVGKECRSRWWRQE